VSVDLTALANGGDEAALPCYAVCVSDGALTEKEVAPAALAVAPEGDAVVATFAATAGDAQSTSSASEITVARDARMRICRG
jgi:hypothetical protein